ncbi:hypothetical protein [Photobacterium kishitanii]|uniref:Uncharacterized protein n=1 Tax=Photobacterium kishitanii TaxID=318456 RepID=A0A2T3KMQ9_9GAMM|nr:hypothetical protein [Photobacterium kishitanii]PSV01083.1 hypothetical protein C9J27_03430 [Photobacterium kishitanii]
MIQISDIFDDISSPDVLISSADFDYNFCLSTCGNSYVFNQSDMYLSVCSWELTPKGYISISAKDLKVVIASDGSGHKLKNGIDAKILIVNKGERLTLNAHIIKGVPSLSRAELSRYVGGELNAIDQLLIEQRKYAPIYFFLGGALSIIFFMFLF